MGKTKYSTRKASTTKPPDKSKRKSTRKKTPVKPANQEQTDKSFNKFLPWATLEWEKFSIRTGISAKIDQSNIVSFLDQLQITNPSKPNMWKQIAKAIVISIEKATSQRIPYLAQKSLKQWETKRVNAMTEESLIEPSQAPYFRPDQMSPFWDCLWTGNLLIHKQVAAISYIAYMTGARTIEVTSLNIEDIKKREDQSVVFIKMPLRRSKTNKYKERREAITLPVTKHGLKPIIDWLNLLTADKTTGKLFPGVDTDKVNYHYRKTAAKLDWSINPTGHSMRVSFVVNAVIAGVPDAHIVACCRWSTDAMLNVYKNAQLQDTIYGSAFQVVRIVEAHMHSGGLISPANDLQPLPDRPRLQDMSTSLSPPPLATAMFNRQEPIADTEQVQENPVNPPQDNNDMIVLVKDTTHELPTSSTVTTMTRPSSPITVTSPNEKCIQTFFPCAQCAYNDENWPTLYMDVQTVN